MSKNTLNKSLKGRLCLLLSGLILVSSPSIQAGPGLWDYLKKCVPSFLTGKALSESQNDYSQLSEAITPDQTEISTEMACNVSTKNTSNKVAIISFVIGTASILAYEIYKALKNRKLYDKYLNDPDIYQEAPAKEIETVKNIAKDLGFTEKDIEPLKIKTLSQEYSDESIARATYNSIEINEHELKKRFGVLFSDENMKKIKKFIFGHELSHIKLNHNAKRIFLINPIIKAAIFGISSILLHKIFGLNSKLSTIIILGFELLSDFKIGNLKLYMPIIENQLFKICEKNADLGSASTGQDAIFGGILFFEAMKKMINQKIESSFSKYHITSDSGRIKFMNFIMLPYLILSDNHPLTDSRSTYLKKLLTNDHKEELEIAIKEMGVSFEKNEIKDLFSDILGNVRYKAILDGIDKGDTKGLYQDIRLFCENGISKEQKTKIQALLDECCDISDIVYTAIKNVEERINKDTLINNIALCNSNANVEE